MKFWKILKFTKQKWKISVMLELNALDPIEENIIFLHIVNLHALFMKHPLHVLHNKMKLQKEKTEFS